MKTKYIALLLSISTSVNAEVVNRVLVSDPYTSEGFSNSELLLVAECSVIKADKTETPWSVVGTVVPSSASPNRIPFSIDMLPKESLKCREKAVVSDCDWDSIVYCESSGYAESNVVNFRGKPIGPNNPRVHK